jgi:tetratricopeptide (TPR) repeat protein
LLIVALLAFYGYRAFEGVVAGWDFDRGHLWRNLGDYTQAAPLLEASAVGEVRRRALIMAGRARLDLWEDQVRRGGALGADSQELVGAAEDFLLCRCASPAAREAWTGLGEVYAAVQWIGRETRAETPYVRPENPWERVGRPGRIAVGMFRESLEVAPTWGRLHDRLALTYWNYGLDELAREAVRASARALPYYWYHPYDKVPELPDWVLEEFVAASREVLGQVPLFPRHGHLIALGKLERRIGAHDRAIMALSEALAAGGDSLMRGEASLHLGLSLVAVDRPDEARIHLEAALQQPVFRVSALRALVDLAEAQGDHEQALRHLRKLRWDQPDELWPCLRLANVARSIEDWDAALEALRWAKLKHPDDPRPYIGLAETHLEMANLAAARSVVTELEELSGSEDPAALRIRRAIDRAAGR